MKDIDYSEADFAPSFFLLLGRNLHRIQFAASPIQGDLVKFPTRKIETMRHVPNYVEVVNGIAVLIGTETSVIVILLWKYFEGVICVMDVWI